MKGGGRSGGKRIRRPATGRRPGASGFSLFGRHQKRGGAGSAPETRKSDVPNRAAMPPVSGRIRRPPKPHRPSGGGLLGRLPNPLAPRDSEVHFRGRLDFIIGLFLLSFSVLGVRAADLTILQGDALRIKAERQHLRKVVVPASRGRILDRQGRTLATSLPVKTLSLDANRLDDADALATQLAPLLNTPRDQILERLNRARPNTFPVLQRQLSPQTAQAIEDLDHPALFFIPELKRFYPMGEITSHILGFVNFEGDGVEGMERAFDDSLQGQPGSRLITRDRLGRPMPQATTLEPAHPGTDLVLTIDTTIQYVAYRALLKAFLASHALSATVVVMDPRNGEVLALANQPSFNPNNLADSDAPSRRNRAIMDTYEPGSTFKIFTVAAALDLGVVQPDTLFDVEGGSVRIGDRTIRDSHRGHRMLTAAQILQKSSNVGAAKIGLLTGNQPQENYIYRFGFGRPTGIELDFESNGSIPDITSYWEVGLANRSFGQGISATPIQLANAAVAAINGGLLYTPRLVAGQMRNGLLAPSERRPPEQVITPQTSARLRDILVGVVGPEGTAPRARVEGYTAAGKTGTAQKASRRGGYAAGKHFASFIGFVPAEDPRLLVYVGVDEPQGSYYGGVVAAPVFREIAQEVLPLLAVLPETPQKPPLPPIAGRVFDPNNPPEPVDSTAELTQVSLGHALAFLRERGIVPQVRGHGRIASQNELPGGVVELVLEP